MERICESFFFNIYFIILLFFNSSQIQIHSDIWLYYYSNKNYTWLIKTIFETVTNLQIIKFDFFEKFFGWNHYRSYLPLSNYMMYTDAKFQQAEESSSALLDSNFTFFVYTVPEHRFLLHLYWFSIF